jgi:hypothetical protein
MTKYSIRRTSDFAYLLDSYWACDDKLTFEFSGDVQKMLDSEIRYLSTPSAWYSKGQKFGVAAQVLHRELQSADDDVDEIVAFLYGVAIENLFEGILAARGVPYAELVNEGHNIKKLFNRCEKEYGVDGLSEFISPEHYVFLDPLTLYIKWVGKYTLPREVKELAVILATNSARLGGGGILPAIRMPFDDLNSIYNRLSNYLAPLIE